MDIPGGHQRDGFWYTLSGGMGLEVNPAQSVEDLTQRSTLIVSGSVIKVRPGPENPVPADIDDPKFGHTTILTVAVEDTVLGRPGTTVDVGVSSSSEGLEPHPEDVYVGYLEEVVDLTQQELDSTLPSARTLTRSRHRVH